MGNGQWGPMLESVAPTHKGRASQWGQIGPGFRSCPVRPITWGHNHKVIGPQLLGQVNNKQLELNSQQIMLSTYLNNGKVSYNCLGLNCCHKPPVGPSHCLGTITKAIGAWGLFGRAGVGVGSSGQLGFPGPGNNAGHKLPVTGITNGEQLSGLTSGFPPNPVKVVNGNHTIMAWAGSIKQ